MVKSFAKWHASWELLSYAIVLPIILYCLVCIHPAKCTSSDQSTPKELKNDDYFMATAFLAALRSKDPKTKVKCYYAVVI